MKVNKNKNVCKDFLKGICKNGRGCDKKHPRGLKGSKKKVNRRNKKQADPNNKKPRNSKSVAFLSCKTKLSDENCEEFLKDECNDQYCKKIHNFSLKHKEEINEEFARRYFSLCQDFSVLEPFEKKLFSKSTLDIMFIVDCTGSMKPWIDATKDELDKILTFIKDNNPYSKIRVSFVGYRDYCDKNLTFKLSPEIDQNGPNPGVNTGRFSYIDFEEDSSKIKHFIASVEARGGGDEPEDLAGGLDLGLKQDWKSLAKYAIIICDAPCHGKKYHDLFGDQYPKGDAKGLVMENLVKEYAARDINLFAITIKNTTRKMYNILSDTYQQIAKKPIKIADLGSSTENFAFFVAYGASNTLTSITNNHINLNELLMQLNKETVVNSDLTVINNDVGNTFNNIGSGTVVNDMAIDNSYNYRIQDFFKRLNSMLSDDESLRLPSDATLNRANGLANDKDKEQKAIEVKFDIAPEDDKEPDWNGLSDKILQAKCHSFAIVRDRNTIINWKKPLIIESSIDSTVAISNKPFSQGAMRFAFFMKDTYLEQNLVCKLPKVINPAEYNIPTMSKELETITCCQHIVKDFNDRVIEYIPDTRLLLSFVNCWIYEILDNSHPYKYYYVENYINGYYEKYNNNAGWINNNLNESALIAQTFSHFSWQITKGYLMIVDLQGVGGVLTDPQIHCLNPKKFGKGNLGYVGIMKFFMSHVCNHYCRRLDLIHPRQNVKIDKDYEFFVDKFIPPDDNLIISRTCDICRNPFKIKAKTVYENRKKCFDNICEECDAKRKASLKDGDCVVCGSHFKSCEFMYKIKRQQFPDKCMKCRSDTRTKMRNDIEDNLEVDDA
jgi:hypothetical protein